VKASGKQNNQFAEISEYVENRREIEDSKSVPVGSLVGQNETLEPIGSHTQPSEPIGDKNRITSMTLNFFLICIVGGGVQAGSTRHVGHLLAYCTCPG
jgi:hypothetical protein